MLVAVVFPINAAVAATLSHVVVAVASAEFAGGRSDRAASATSFLRLKCAHINTQTHFERNTTAHTDRQAKSQRIRVPHLMGNKLTSG